MSDICEVTTRQLKVSRLVQRELGNIFQQDIKSLFHKAFITVTQVRISPDLATAKVYLSFMLVDDPSKGLQMIESRKKDVRRMLSTRIGRKMRVVPELHFYLDDSADYASRIDKILSGLDIPQETDNED